MTMVQAILAQELTNLAPTDVESEAAQALTDAYGVFASAATGAGVPITPAGVDLGKAAMLPALSGMSVAGTGLAAIPAAIVAFWGAVAGGLATSFPGATIITPPPHATLPTSFITTTEQNKNSNLSLEAAAVTIAAVMYADAIVGGTVTLAGAPPVVGPIL